ncbi:MAG: 6-phosphofructokinase [Deltaproteobacteria bacterium]|nr:6-phosphofructokinase [Deltaproteobacteria bacterium]
MNIRKIGILTGGGDCPGLNAVIRAVVTQADRSDVEVLGIRGGWRGFLENDTIALNRTDTRGILHVGGTILGTTRVNPFQEKGGPERVDACFKAWNLDALIAVGGEGTLTLANKVFERGNPVVGVPKTIDNDLDGTEVTFGFDTAITVATDAIDRLRTTAEAHERVMVVEVMGRHAGWIAMHAGLAGGADVIVIPERPTSIDEICEIIHLRRAEGKVFSLVVVAEGAMLKPSKNGEAQLVLANDAPDAFGRPRLGGIGPFIARAVEEVTGIESRFTVLGHTQRGGSPTARDRVLALRFGVRAMQLVEEGEFGRMVALKGDDIVALPLSEATAKHKVVDEEWLKLAEVFTGV